MRKNWAWRKLSPWGKIWHVVQVILSLLAVLIMFAGFLYIAFLVLMIGSAVLELQDVILRDLIDWLAG